jgi:hypothetical protein
MGQGPLDQRFVGEGMTECGFKISEVRWKAARHGVSGSN